MFWEGAGGGGWWVLNRRALIVFPNSLGDIGRRNHSIVSFMDSQADIKPNWEEIVQRLHPWRLFALNSRGERSLCLNNPTAQ